MVSVFKYAYPNAKVRAMKGRLLSKEDFRVLLNTETYEDVLRALQRTSYSETLSQQSSSEISPRVLTNIVYQHLFIDYEKTIRAISGDIRSFFILFYQQYELVNLKTILRGICGQVDPQQVLPLLLPTAHHPLFSKERLLEFRDVHDLVNHLQGSFFQYPLNQALKRYEEEQEFFPLEMALDLYYYQTLWEAMKKLPERERQTVQRILGMYVDIMNVAWIIRFKEQYHFSKEEILNYTIHHGYAFKLKDRRKLSEASNPAQVLEYLKRTPYGKAISGNEPLHTLHVVLSRCIIAELRKQFAGNPFHIGVIIGYLLLKEYEISDIITIAEAKKYGYSFEQSQSYVIHAEVGER